MREILRFEYQFFFFSLILYRRYWHRTEVSRSLLRFWHRNKLSMEIPIDRWSEEEKNPLFSLSLSLFLLLSLSLFLSRSFSNFILIDLSSRNNLQFLKNSLPFLFFSVSWKSLRWSEHPFDRLTDRHRSNVLFFKSSSIFLKTNLMQALWLIPIERRDRIW